MELERIALVLRARTPWEAMDLGVAMARAWWRQVWGAWFAVYVPVAVVVHLVLLDHLIIASITLWWLKPAFDRVVLHVLGTAVFDAPPRVRDTLRALRQALTPGLLANLTFYRFDLARSFNLPIWQLERARGLAGWQRARILHRKARGHAVWLTIIFIHFEMVMALSLMMLVSMLTPAPYDSSVGFSALFAGSRELPLWQALFNNLLYMTAMSLIEPIYVAGGFALYMNRRTQLEAWDLELALRRLNERAPRSLAHAAACCVLALAAVLCANPPLNAADAPAKSARAEIVQVFKEPEFDRYREAKTWRYTGRGLEFGEQQKKDDRKGFDWENLGIFLATLVRALMWIGAALLVGWLLWLAARYARLWGGPRAAEYRPPDALFGLDVRPASLPADVAAVALALCAEQRVREALSLLYRGALSWLLHERQLEVRAGDTEQDCLQSVAGRGEPSAAYFGELVAAWQLAAYGGRLLPPTAAEQLCVSWRQHFTLTPAAA